MGTLVFVSYFSVCEYAGVFVTTFLSYLSVCEYTGVFVPTALFVGTLLFVLPFYVWVHWCFCHTVLCVDTLVFLSVCGYADVFVPPFYVWVH